MSYLYIYIDLKTEIAYGKMSSREIMELAIRRREILTYLYRNRRRNNATEVLVVGSRINGIKDRVITTLSVTETGSSSSTPI